MKKSNLKRVLALALALCMCLPLITVPAFADTVEPYVMYDFTTNNEVTESDIKTALFATTNLGNKTSVSDGRLVVPFYKDQTNQGANSNLKFPAVSVDSNRYFSMEAEITFDKKMQAGEGLTIQLYNASVPEAVSLTSVDKYTHYGVESYTETPTDEAVQITGSSSKFTIPLVQIQPQQALYTNAKGGLGQAGKTKWNLTTDDNATTYDTIRFRIVIDLELGHFECYINDVLDYSSDLTGTYNLKYYASDKSQKNAIALASLKNVSLTANQLNLLNVVKTSSNEDRNAYIDNLCFETLALEAPETLDAGSIRVGSNATGLRFATQVNADSLAAIKELTQVENVEVGTLITLEDYVTGAGAATFESLKAYQDTQNVVTYLDVPATVGTWYENSELGNGTDKLFVGSIVNIKDANLNTNMVGRGYVKVTYNDGRAPQYFYSDTSATKNVSEIARAFVANLNLESPEWAPYATELQRLAAPSSAQ